MHPLVFCFFLVYMLYVLFTFPAVVTHLITSEIFEKSCQVHINQPPQLLNFLSSVARTDYSRVMVDVMMTWCDTKNMLYKEIFNHSDNQLPLHQH